MLLIGPPGSGKTHFVLVRLEAAIREGRAPQVKLIVPTASMAQHTLHTLARRDLVVPGQLVATMADFVAALTPALRTPAPAVESWLLKGAIEATSRKEFAQIKTTAGLHAVVLKTIQEFWAEGSSASAAARFLKTPQQAAFAEVFRDYERRLEQAGYVHPGMRFRQAASGVREGALVSLREMFFDGFLNFTAGEHEIVQAVLDAVENTTVTLPEDPQRKFTRSSTERLKHVRRPRVRPQVIQAFTPLGEVEETARQIIEGKRPFHNYGIVLRTPDHYAPLIQSIFERLRIPFRLRLPQPLAHHASARFVAGLLRVVSKGFPAEETLDILKRTVSPLGLDPSMDQFDFSVRQNLPGNGLAFLKRQAGSAPSVARLLERLGSIANWRNEKVAPREWAVRSRSLQHGWLRLPPVGDAIPMARVLELRSLAEAIPAIAQAASDAADLLEHDGIERAALPQYLDAFESVLQNTVLRTADQRRNVVNVLSIHEARQ